jgi:peptide/nickel transport system substrate-binding protein
MGLTPKILGGLWALIASLATADAQVTLRVVPHSDLKIIDPIWSPVYITRNHGSLIYDTLFAMAEQGEIRPQMVEKYAPSADKLTHVFTLRDGLKHAETDAE